MAAPRTTIRTLAALGAAALTVAAVVAIPSSTAATPRHHSTAKDAPVTPGAVYLALGDSVPFGYRESTSKPTPNYTKQGTLIGYPTIVANDLHLKLTNASCPGETTTSMLNPKRQDNGCSTDASGNSEDAYRPNFPLHVKYTGSQMQFAHNFLVSHPNTKLVTLMIGANDGFVCQEKTTDHCTSPNELAGVLGAVAKHVTTILKRLRDSGYMGQIVIVNYYSLNSASADATAESQALNGTIANAAAPYDVKIADAFKLFARDSKNATGNDTCAAGLLTILSSGCGVHPSFAGQAVLATAAEQVIKKS